MSVYIAFPLIHHSATKMKYNCYFLCQSTNLLLWWRVNILIAGLVEPACLATAACSEEQTRSKIPDLCTINPLCSSVSDSCMR